MPVNALDYALVIGLNDYPSYGGANGRTLKGAIRDATDFADWLLDQNTGGGVPPANLKLVTSTPNPLAPDKQRIDAELLSIVQAARQHGGRRLYIYFSGHGHVSGDVYNEVALCLPHWSADWRHAALSSSGYVNYVLKCSPFEEILVFFDCCRVKQVAALGENSGLDCPLAVAQKRKVLWAYASEFLKPAFEGAASGNGAGTQDDPAEEVRGHFTKALLAALKAGAARPQGGVSVRSLKSYLESNVERIARGAGHNQRPQVPLDMEDADQDAIVLGSAVPEANVVIQFSPGRHGTIELEAPNLEILKAGDAATGPWRVRLEKGIYLLRELATGTEQTLRFVPAGEVVNVTF
jgi:hypothetical protein